MQTPTHALINWTIAPVVAKWVGCQQIPTSAVLIGAVAPDLALYALSFGGAAWFRWGEGRPWGDVMRHMYGNLFYNDPWWISFHNLLHSPLVLVVALLALYAYLGQAAFVHSWWVWFFGSCMLHTLVDIPVHHDDGPLVFWPLHWGFRFESPVSYWDPKHYGRIMVPFEIVLMTGLGINAVFRWFQRQ